MEEKRETAEKKAEEQNPAKEPEKRQNPEAGACCCEKQKHRGQAELSDLIHRLNRVEGQIRGIRSMVENDAYCVDILTQVSAASAALTAFSRVLLNNHVRTCVVEDIRGGGDEKTEELLAVLQKFMR
ncbi:MAG: metal-sensing transcriptional repressor [Lachnospiraceae bacterium]|nr:metal-sensing transcriptional repressor [Lachnospiraceae bacterium]